MSVGMLFDSDQVVANWLFATYGQRRYSYDRCLGLLRDGMLCGAVLFHNWNGANVEVSYYGKGTMTPGVLRCIATFTLNTFDPSRLTAHVPKRDKHYIKGLLRLGFRVEGAQRCYYGKKDCLRNSAIQLVAFREAIEQVASLATPKSA